jgi:hypothetical protein
MREFPPGRESVKDARRPPGFICHSRIQAALEEMPNVPFQQLGEISHHSPSIVFYVLTFTLRLKFQHWKWIPHFRSEEDKTR